MRGRQARLAVAAIALCSMVGCGVHSEQEAAKPLRSPGQVTDFVGTKIARFKRPHVVVFTDALPRTAEGAVDRDAVKAKFGATA